MWSSLNVFYNYFTYKYSMVEYRVIVMPTVTCQFLPTVHCAHRQLVSEWVHCTDDTVDTNVQWFPVLIFRMWWRVLDRHHQVFIKTKQYGYTTTWLVLIVQTSILYRGELISELLTRLTQVYIRTFWFWQRPVLGWLSMIKHVTK